MAKNFPSSAVPMTSASTSPHPLSSSKRVGRLQTKRASLDIRDLLKNTLNHLRIGASSNAEWMAVHELMFEDLEVYNGHFHLQRNVRTVIAA